MRLGFREGYYAYAVRIRALLNFFVWPAPASFPLLPLQKAYILAAHVLAFVSAESSPPNCAFAGCFWTKTVSSKF